MGKEQFDPCFLPTFSKILVLLKIITQKANLRESDEIKKIELKTKNRSL